MALRYLALGDSYTIGEGVTAEARWPMQLASALRAEGRNIDDPQVIATTGWTTDELDAGIDATEPVGTFDLVSLAIGVNNQYRGRSVDEYRLQLTQLLKRTIGFAGGRASRVLMLSIPDWGFTPFAVAQGRHGPATSQAIDAFNAAAQALCINHDIAFVDITPVSRARGMDTQMLADDGLHPSAAMYALWTALALPVVRKALL